MSSILQGCRLKEFWTVILEKMIKPNVVIKNGSEKIPKNKYRDFIIHCAEYKL